MDEGLRVVAEGEDALDECVGDGRDAFILGVLDPDSEALTEVRRARRQDGERDALSGRVASLHGGHNPQLRVGDVQRLGALGGAHAEREVLVVVRLRKGMSLDALGEGDELSRGNSSRRHIGRSVRRGGKTKREKQKRCRRCGMLFR